MERKKHIKTLVEYLNEGLYEREDVLKLALLAAFAGESLFMLGPPGVAKSMIARRMSHLFGSGRSFEYLMNRFSTPDELFGPIAISKLKNEDKYERVTEHYLPWADVVFLDEIWKAGPSIQNALLTIVNEKLYRNGQQEIQVPLKLLVAASNELPNKGQGLEALWDRFIIRTMVVNMTTPKNFDQFIQQSSKVNPDFELPDDLKINEEEYQAWRKAIREVQVPKEVVGVIKILRSYLDKHNQKQDDPEQQLYVSDRRWRKIVGILQTSAFLNERESVDLMDCFLIAHALWNEPDQIPVVQGFVEDAIEKHGYGFNVGLPYFTEEIKALEKDINDEISSNKNGGTGLHPVVIQHWNQEVKRLHNGLDKADKELKDYRDKELKGLRQNLFIKPESAKLIERNLEQSKNALIEKKQQLVKLKKRYDAL